MEAQQSETILIQQLCEGNEHAYKEVYRLHYAVLCAYARQFVNDDFEAESIVDDVILHLWEIRQQLRIDRSLRSYLISCVHNRCMKAHPTKSVAGPNQTPTILDRKRTECPLPHAVGF